MTTKEKRIVRAIVGSIEEKGYPPTIKEISEQIKISPYLTGRILKDMEKKQYITREYRKPRTIKLASSHVKVLVKE